MECSPMLTASSTDLFAREMRVWFTWTQVRWKGTVWGGESYLVVGGGGLCDQPLLCFCSREGRRSTLWFSVGDAASTLVGGGGHRLYLSPALPPFGGVSSSSRTEVVTRRYRSSVDVTRRDCSAGDVTRRCCCSAVDVARLCCLAVEVARLCCSAVDVARRLRSVVEVAWDPLALSSGPMLPPPVSLLLLTPPTCLALILAPPTCLAFDPRFPSLASLLLLAPPLLASPCFSLPPPASLCSSFLFRTHRSTRLLGRVYSAIDKVTETNNAQCRNQVMLLFLMLALSSLVHSAPLVNTSLPLDCEDVYQIRVMKNASAPSGVYTIYPAGSKPVKVYCDMGCVDSNGHHDGQWTVIQRRINGNVSFYRPWAQYKEGFGNAASEYWLGLENIYKMTYTEKYQLRVDMEDFEKGSAYAQYTMFCVEQESTDYRLNIGGYINGGAGDSLSYVNGIGFSTFDKEISGNCAETYSGGFWYNYWTCHYANPNGLYKYGNVGTAYTGVMWQTWKGYNYSLKTIVMKIRRMKLEDLTEV
ncbi:hypothetical protein QTP86_028837 [Hemibagrus guttatus]|nr:hypothetical protein QTP86_028837 [Hemibagrus guttatus]